MTPFRSVIFSVQIVRDHKIMDGTAYLLEKAGDVQGAFDILLTNLLEALHLFYESVVDKTKAENGKGKIMLCHNLPSLVKLKWLGAFKEQ